jgi:hypothetical protein
MARTRRRHSYRKSRRWNPEMAPGFKAALASTPAKPTGYASMAAAPNPRGRRRGMRSGRFTKAKPFRLVTTGPGRYLNNSTDWEDMGGRAAAYVKKYGWPSQGGYQGNPRGRSSRASRARSWHRKVRESVPYWSRGKNPRKGRYYNGRKSTRRGNPSKYRYAKTVLRKLSRSRRKHVVSYALGQMNPRGHRGHRRKSRSHKARSKRNYEWSRRISRRNPGRRHRTHRHVDRTAFHRYGKKALHAHRMASRHHTGASTHKSRRRKKWAHAYGRRIKQARKITRRNPAQFPMPFVSAMNPRRRRSKRGRR